MDKPSFTYANARAIISPCTDTRIHATPQPDSARNPVINDNYFCRSCCLTGECYRTFGGFQLTPTGPISPSRTSSISLFSAEAYTSCLAITPRHCLTLR